MTVDDSGKNYKVVRGIVNGGRPTSAISTHLLTHSIKAKATDGKAAEMLVNVMQLGGKRQTITPSDIKEIAHDYSLSFDEKFLYEK